jgi:hypothetical protein
MGEEADGDLLELIRHRCCRIPLPGKGGSRGAYLSRRQRGRRSSSIRTLSSCSSVFTASGLGRFVVVELYGVTSRMSESTAPHQPELAHGGEHRATPDQARARRSARWSAACRAPNRCPSNYVAHAPPTTSRLDPEWGARAGAASLPLRPPMSSHPRAAGGSAPSAAVASAHDWRSELGPSRVCSAVDWPKAGARALQCVLFRPRVGRERGIETKRGVFEVFR